jgi:hypothetical protein
LLLRIDLIGDWEVILSSNEEVVDITGSRAIGDDFCERISRNEKSRDEQSREKRGWLNSDVQRGRSVGYWIML